MKQVLIIWNMIPDDTHFYLIPQHELTETHLEYLKQAQGCIVNCDEINNGLEFLMAAFSPEMQFVSDEWKEYGCIFHKYQIETVKEVPLEAEVSTVYYSGIYL